MEVDDETVDFLAWVAKSYPSILEEYEEHRKFMEFGEKLSKASKGLYEAMEQK